MGLSIGVGLALSLKRKKMLDKKVYVLLGDGECNEGSIWEATMCANHYKLDNLTIIVDRNKLQQTGESDKIMSLGDLAGKFNSFGSKTYSIDGHNFEELFSTFSKNENYEKTKAVIANTIKGKSISFAENDNKFHHTILTKTLYEQAKKEINEI